MKKLFGVFKRSLMRYFTKEKPDIHAEEAKTSSFCTNAITDVLETDGKRWLIPINIALFLPGLLFFDRMRSRAGTHARYSTVFGLRGDLLHVFCFEI